MEDIIIFIFIGVGIIVSIYGVFLAIKKSKLKKESINCSICGNDFINEADKIPLKDGVMCERCFEKSQLTNIVPEKYRKNKNIYFGESVKKLKEEISKFDDLSSEEQQKIKKSFYTSPSTTRQVKDITCPKCNSTQFMAGNKKVSGKGAIIGSVIAGPIGALIGSKSSKQVVITCLNCGHRWKAGNRK